MAVAEPHPGPNIAEALALRDADSKPGSHSTAADVAAATGAPPLLPPAAASTAGTPAQLLSPPAARGSSGSASTSATNVPIGH